MGSENDEPGADSSSKADAGPRLAEAIGWAVLILSAIVFARRIRLGLQLFEWPDETDKFVAAQLIAHGHRLYLDIFAHHGPLPYLLAHGYVSVVSASDFSWARLLVATLGAIVCAAVSCSPALRSTVGRIWAGALGISFLSAFWLMQGMHMLLYQHLCGFLFAIALAQAALPAAMGEPVSPMAARIAGFVLALGCFCAYAFVPAALLIAIATLVAVRANGRGVRVCAYHHLTGSLVAITVVGAWLLIFGDVPGFLVYHIYFNQHIYASFIELSWLGPLRNLNLSIKYDARIHLLATAGLCGWSVFAMREAQLRRDSRHDSRGGLWAVALLVLAVLMINPRGDTKWQDGGYVAMNIAAAALIMARALETRLAKNPGWRDSLSRAAIAVIAIGAVEVAAASTVSTQTGVEKAKFEDHVVNPKPELLGLHALARSLAGPDGRILSLIFDPSIYIKVGRLPASGDYYYLPWQAAYARQSVLGYRIDLCKDIESRRPAVIWFDDNVVWGKYRLADYEPCVLSLIGTQYKRLESPGSFYYVRADIADRLDLPQLKQQFNLPHSTRILR